MDNRRPAIRIVIANNHPIFRDGLRRLLEAEPRLKVIGEASDGSDAVKLARQLKPDILLLDLAMPRQPGLEALRGLSVGSGANGVKVILLTAAAEKHQLVEALQLGVRGVVLKGSATQSLIRSIHTVMRGGYWIDPGCTPSEPPDGSAPPLAPVGVPRPRGPKTLPSQLVDPEGMQS